MENGECRVATWRARRSNLRKFLSKLEQILHAFLVKTIRQRRRCYSYEREVFGETLRVAVVLLEPF